MEQRYFSLKDSATYLGLSEKILYRWASRKEIPAFKLGSVWRFDRAQLDLWVKSGYNQSQSSGSVVDLGQRKVLNNAH